MIDSVRSCVHGLKAGVYHPSNAEQYFPFSRQHRVNVLGLLTDAKSMVVRTRAWPTSKDPKSGRSSGSKNGTTRANSKNISFTAESHARRNAILRQPHRLRPIRPRRKSSTTPTQLSPSRIFEDGSRTRVFDVLDRCSPRHPVSITISTTQFSRGRLSRKRGVTQRKSIKPFHFKIAMALVTALPDTVEF